ncbi:MAG: hypothetical protein AAB856_00480 [Patescibacteria group bacterium]
MDTSLVIPESVLQQNPLFWSGQGSIAVNFSQPNIFIGTGIATPNELSQEIPFDVLGFLLSAEFIKRQIPNSKVFLLIADQHAWLANKFPESNSNQIALNQKLTFGKVISRLKLLDWHISLASELFPQAEPDSYENMETRDVFHFFNNQNTGIKMGWKFVTKDKTHKTDEAHFDQNLDFDIRSIFIKPGVTLDPTKPFESPYICTNPSKRVLLSKNENVVKKLDSRSTTGNQRQAVQNQLKRITILFEQIVEQLPDKTPVAKKVQLIIEKIFKP